MNTQYLRELIVRQPLGVKRLVLTEHSAALVRLVAQQHYITSSRLAKQRKISFQNASAQLRDLWRKGYLKREEGVDTRTGGIYYIYSSLVPLENI